MSLELKVVCRTHMRLRVFVVALFAMTAWAESGVPGPLPFVCNANACSCHGTTCSCGDVCTASGCAKNQAQFCTNDGHCTGLTCGQFVCELNGCVLVKPDAGRLVEPRPPPAKRLDSVDTALPIANYGCSSSLGTVGVLAVVAVLFRRLR